VEFCLHYNGKLKSQDNAAGKHAIRIALHKQIKSICNSEPFSLVFEPDRNGKRESGKAMFLEHEGKRFWFLISEHLATLADLKITLLLPHKVGKLVQNGGDIDNRIKTLFDGLRIPAALSEIPSTDSFDYGQEGMYCLLQDDKLINRIAIQTYQDYASPDNDSVRCFIEIQTRVTAALWGNFQFL